MKTTSRLGVVSFAALLLMATAAGAQVTPDMKAKIAAIGAVVDPPSTIALYAPLHASAPYKGLTVARDLPYAPEARTVLDVFTPQKAAGKRPVLLFVPGGAGNKIEPGPGGEHFYDNVMLWAVKNGMVGVNMQRRGMGQSPKDVVEALAWVRKTIAQYGGDPDRIFIWGHSAGAVTVSNYIGHPELYGPGGVGVKGAVLMAGIYDLYPLEMKSPPMIFRMGMPKPGAPPAPPPGPPPAPPPSDPAMRAQRSILPAMKAIRIPVFLSAAELDPPLMLESMKTLNDQMTAARNKPTMVVYKDHGHMSEIFAVNTADVSTSKPILDWMRRIK